MGYEDSVRYGRCAQIWGSDVIDSQDDLQIITRLDAQDNLDADADDISDADDDIDDENED